MKIGVDVKGIEAVKAHLAGLGKQVAFTPSTPSEPTGSAISSSSYKHLPASSLNDGVGEGDCKRARYLTRSCEIFGTKSIFVTRNEIAQ